MYCIDTDPGRFAIQTVYEESELRNVFCYHAVFALRSEEKSL